MHLTPKLHVMAVCKSKVRNTHCLSLGRVSTMAHITSFVLRRYAATFSEIFYEGGLHNLLVLSAMPAESLSRQAV